MVGVNFRRRKKGIWWDPISYIFSNVGFESFLPQCPPKKYTMVCSDQKAKTYLQSLPWMIRWHIHRHFFFVKINQLFNRKRAIIWACYWIIGPHNLKLERSEPFTFQTNLVFSVAVSSYRRFDLIFKETSIYYHILRAIWHVLFIDKKSTLIFYYMYIKLTRCTTQSKLIHTINLRIDHIEAPFMPHNVNLPSIISFYYNIFWV